MAVVNSKIVSFDVKHILAFVAKRKRDSGFMSKLTGRELEHIKRINVLLTGRVKHNYAYSLPQTVLVEVFPQGPG
jgi:hypothetical protein